MSTEIQSFESWAAAANDIDIDDGEYERYGATEVDYNDDPPF